MAAMGSSPVVMCLVLGKDRPQMPLAEDQHPVGYLGPGREHGPLRMGIRAGTSGRDLDRFDASTGHGRAERCAELPGSDADLSRPKIRFGGGPGGCRSF